MISEKKILADLIKYLESKPDIRVRYQADIQHFKQQFEQAKLDRYRLGVIGVTSSGKSTMINAVMQQKLLTMAVQPSSSQLVTCSKNEKEQVTVYFEDKPPKIEIGKSLNSILTYYGDERNNPGNILHVKQLEVSTPKFAFPEEVLLIDSPGLDAYGFEGHEKLTMNSLLPTIDFCIFVTTCKTNSDCKMRSVLDIIADYDCPLIIVQNMIDSLKPSPDGKKNVDKVAKEHLIRIERIINESRINDKSNVKIIQISSKWALEAYISNNPIMTKSKKAEYLKKSNFNSLIKAVESIFEQIRPKVENRRLSKIKNQLVKIVIDAKADLLSTEQERNNLIFLYTGYDKKIKKLFSSAQATLSDVIINLECERNAYQKRSEKFTESVLNNIRNSAKNAENKMLDTTKQFLNSITEYCNVFNLDARRIRILDSFGVAPGLQIHATSKSRKVKKQGFVSGIARFFGSIFDTDWGYENVIESVYDHEQTRKNVINFYNSIILLYSSLFDKWESSANTQVNLLLSQYQNRLEAYEARKQSLLDEEKTREVILKLEKIIDSIPTFTPTEKGKNIFVENPVLSNDLFYAKIDFVTYSMVKAAKMLQNRIHSKIIRLFVSPCDLSNSIIIGWDYDCISRFINNSFNYQLSELNDGLTKIDGLSIFKNMVFEKMIFDFQKPRCIFVIFNALQFGSGLNDVNRSGFINKLSSKDKLFFVIQDFEELIIGEGISEAIQNMQLIPQKLSFENQYRILINHNNPIYNLVITELQQHPCITHTDEIALLNEIQERFPYLRTPQVDKHISEVISAFRKHRNK